MHYQLTRAMHKMKEEKKSTTNNMLGCQISYKKLLFMNFILNNKQNIKTFPNI